MKLSVRHEFPCTVAEFWTAFWDAELDRRIQRGAGLVRSLTTERTEGTTRFLKYRYTPDKTLPAAVAKVLGTDKLVYDQELTFDGATQHLRWKVIPLIMPEKIASEGTFSVVASPGGCTRTVDGVIEVRIPLIGGRIEAAILQEVEASYASAAAITRAFVQEQKGNA